jgi:hypothetical protein
MILAQVEQAEQIAEKAIGKQPNELPSLDGSIFERYQEWLQSFGEAGMPSPEQIAANLQSIGMVAAVILAIFGAIFVIFGWKWFRLLVPVVMAAIGATVAISFAIGYEMATWIWVLAPIFGFLLIFLLSLRFLGVFLVLFSGLAAGAAGGVAWYYGAYALDQASAASLLWIGALVGGGLAIVMILLLFRLILMITTAVTGGLFATAGAMGMALNYESTADPVIRYLGQYPLAPVFVIGVVAIVSFMIQLAWWFREKAADEDEDDKPSAVYGDPSQPRYN